MDKVTITQLDSGYIVQLEDENDIKAQHGVSSNDSMIATVRNLLGISRKTLEKKRQCDEVGEWKKPKYGILAELLGKYPVKKEEWLVPELVAIPNNEHTKFAETSDGRILIEYRMSKVYTSWDEIIGMIKMSTPTHEMDIIPAGMVSNARTGIRQFMIAVRNHGLVRGASVDLDPDKDYRPQLNRNSMPEYERGTLETVESPT